MDAGKLPAVSPPGLGCSGCGGRSVICAGAKWELGNWVYKPREDAQLNRGFGHADVGDVECQLDIARRSPLTHGLDPVALLTVDRPLLPVALVVGAFPAKIPLLSLTKLTHISTHLVFGLCWKVTRFPRGQACPHRKGLTPRSVYLSVHGAVGPCRCSGPRVTCDGAARPVSLVESMSSLQPCPAESDRWVPRALETFIGWQPAMVAGLPGGFLP